MERAIEFLGCRLSLSEVARRDCVSSGVSKVEDKGQI